MRPYLSLLRVRFLNGLQYRAAALGGLATQAFWGVMLVFIYQAFYGGADSVGGFSYPNLVSFTWLQQAFLSFFFIYDYDGELLEMITSGSISYELCRPVHIYQIWYVKLLAKRLAQSALRAGPVILIAALMPHPYNLSLPYSPLAFLLFLITMLLGVLLMVAIVMLIYISIFKTMSPIGSIGILSIVGEFFSGLTIPIPFMPQWLQNVCYALPFRWTGDLPLRTYTGNIAASEALAGIAIQAMWIAALVAFGAYCMKRITRLAVVQGG